jgi:hypothetical protein
VPYSIELNDVPALASAFEGDYLLTLVKRQFDRLYAEGAQSGRVMCLAVHPHVIGQPHRVKYLDLALSYIKSFPDVWFATGRQIAEHYMAHGYNAVQARIEAFKQEEQ